MDPCGLSCDIFCRLYIDEATDDEGVAFTGRVIISTANFCRTGDSGGGREALCHDWKFESYTGTVYGDAEG
jgi:hypothetical protein